MEFLKRENLESSLESCFLVKSFPRIFMMQYLFSEISDNKNTSAWHLLHYIHDDYANVINFYEENLECDTRQKVQKDNKLVFQKNR